MKVLVTGTCGFIFGNFIRKAVYDQNQRKPQDKHIFVSVDKVGANALNSMYWNSNHPFYPADIRDSHIIDVIFQREQPDIVIHGASESYSGDNSFITSNVLGTQILIDASIKYKIKKFIYVSTDKVYGQLTSESDTPWNENSPLNPKSSYAATKVAAELLIKAANQTHGLIYNIVRSSNCYGLRQGPEKLIPKAIKCILNNQKIPVYGQGSQIRDWTYVADNCSAIMTILDKGIANETYNVSANQEFINIEIIQSICNVMGKGHNLIEFAEDPKINRDFRRSVNSLKIRELGWEPSYKFKNGIKDTIQWFTDNQWYFK